MNTTRTRKLAPASADTVPARPARPRSPTDADTAANIKPRRSRSAATTVPAEGLTPAAPAKVSTRATRTAAASTAPKVAAKRVSKAKPAAPTLDAVVRDAVIARLDSMKAHDLKVIDVRGKTSITDCLVIVSGTSTRHVKSMGDEVVVTAKKFGLPPIGIEGEKDAEWMLVDLGDTVVHVMLPKMREFYGLERLWMLAEESRAAAVNA